MDPRINTRPPSPRPWWLRRQIKCPPAPASSYLTEPAPMSGIALTLQAVKTHNMMRLPNWIVGIYFSAVGDEKKSHKIGRFPAATSLAILKRGLRNESSISGRIRALLSGLYRSGERNRHHAGVAFRA